MDKIQMQLPVSNKALEVDRKYIANENGDMVNERGEVCGSVDYETGKVKIIISKKSQPRGDSDAKNHR